MDLLFHEFCPRQTLERHLISTHLPEYYPKGVHVCFLVIRLLQGHLGCLRHTHVNMHINICNRHVTPSCAAASNNHAIGQWGHGHEHGPISYHVSQTARVARHLVALCRFHSSLDASAQAKVEDFYGAVLSEADVIRLEVSATTSHRTHTFTKMLFHRHSTHTLAHIVPPLCTQTHLWITVAPGCT